MPGRDSTDFWTRRREAVAEEARTLEAARQAEEAARLGAEREAEQAGKSDEELLTELGLPDPDSLKAGDDFSAFMAQAVPDHLRRRALRRLWVSNPVLANVDGLLEYGEDYAANPATSDLKTAYQVGKGLLAHVRAMEAREQAPVAADGDAPAEAEVPTDPPVALRSVEVDAVPPTEDMQNDTETPIAAPVRRHMRFTYEE